jgi:FMN phosphatase YigB (HAD superfamily)
VTRAVLLDALGTLVELRPPAPALRRGLVELAGVDVGEEAATAAFRAEIAHYLERHLEGADERSLERLRDDCAAVMHDALGHPAIPRSVVRRAMLEALDFVPFPDAAPALGDLRRAGVRLVVVSNWDCSLPLWLDRAGLLGLVDGVVSSAVVGEAKPSPRPFAAALEQAGVEAAEALHVGDSERADVRGATAAGITPVLLDRSGGPRPAGVRVVRSLAEVPPLI